jgi:hypothetical protein
MRKPAGWTTVPLRVSVDLFWLVYLLRVPITGLLPLLRQEPFSLPPILYTILFLPRR